MIAECNAGIPDATTTRERGGIERSAATQRSTSARERSPEVSEIPTRALAKLDALRERQFATPVDRVGLATHVGLPGVGPGLATAPCFLFTAERTADFGAGRSDVDVGDAAVTARCGQECLGRPHVQREECAGESLAHAIV